MIKDLTPTTIVLREPEPHLVDVPIWGHALIDFIAPRYLLEADQIVSSMYGTGNRTGKKKLYQLSKWDFLKRYELYCKEQEKPIIAYTLSNRGMRKTTQLEPVVTLDKAQEYIIANDYIFMNESALENVKLYRESTLLIGEVTIQGNRLGLWCPRHTEETRIKSLVYELTPFDGLIVIIPNKKIMQHYREELEKVNYSKLIVYTTDKELDKTWIIRDNIFEEITYE